LSEDKTHLGKHPSKNRLKLDQEFKIIGLLGIGGMAEVYKAEQTSLSRMVAIKKLKSSLSQNPEMMERFLREAQSAANLQHENIVQVYQMGEADNEHYIVMEYVEGRDLKSILKNSGPVPWEIAGLIIRGVAQGLQFAHQRGYIHRDIKPGNIMLSYRGEVKIMDFGIVRRMDSELTQTGAFLGTPSYMSPEQLKGQGVTVQSDLFSLGIVLYEILTGEKPFQADTEQALILKITTEKEKAVRRHNSEIPRRLARMVKKILKKNPAKRFRDAEELIQYLDRVPGKKIVARANELIAEYLRRAESLSQEERTKKADQLDSEPVQVATRTRAGRGRGKTKTAQKQGRAIIGNEWTPSQESSWMVKTVILMVITLALILIAILLHSQGYLSDLLNFLKAHF